MFAEWANHLWQSTLFALAAALVTLALRSNRAAVRYWVWLSASVKFLLPLALLVSLGHSIQWAPASAHRIAAQPAISLVTQASQPFTFATAPAPPAPATHHWGVIAMVALWACGFVTIVLMRLADWRRVQAALRASTAANIPAAIEIRSAPGLLEPGVVGLFHPVLLLPQDIAGELQAGELQTVLDHELCHVRRRDNLTASIHMFVEAVFWFHPLVWWIGRQLLEEREQACDEAVLSLGNTPRDYAQALVTVCKSYLQSPLSCISGVTGADLKRRIAAILAGSAVRDLSFVQKLALALAGVAVLALPLALGLTGATGVRAEPENRSLKFATASIKSCPAFRKADPRDLSAGVFHSECTTAERLIEQAYGLFAHGQWNLASSLAVKGGPAWIKSDLFEIEGRARGTASRSAMNGPMLQALLEDRFHLKLHRETSNIPVYALTVAAGGLKLEPFTGTCSPRDFDKPPSGKDCATARGFGSAIELKAATMDDFCAGFAVFLNRQIVNKTGLSGRFDFRVDLPAQDRALLNRPRPLPAMTNPLIPSPPPISLESAQTAMRILGLHLEPAEGRGDDLVIDHVAKPPGS